MRRRRPVGPGRAVGVPGPRRADRVDGARLGPADVERPRPAKAPLRLEMLPGPHRRAAGCGAPGGVHDPELARVQEPDLRVAAGHPPAGRPVPDAPAVPRRPVQLLRPLGQPDIQNKGRPVPPRLGRGRRQVGRVRHAGDLREGVGRHVLAGEGGRDVPRLHAGGLGRLRGGDPVPHPLRDPGGGDEQLDVGHDAAERPQPPRGARLGGAGLGRGRAARPVPGGVRFPPHGTGARREAGGLHQGHVDEVL
mmetsp:Transcript_34147/g.96023  ORF Transcript_34147/g.96023 Transcript_34147/m.96023 type:complete len:250 (-) Transcript_34147:332-1081(-)